MLPFGPLRRAIAALLMLSIPATPALAQRWDHDGPPWERREGPPPHRPEFRGGPPGRDYVIVGREWVRVPPHRVRVYRDVVIRRPYGPWYFGYGHFHTDAEAYRWLGLTAITMALVASLDENQHRALEDAQIRATAAPVGQPIIWSTPGAAGHVVATRDGRTPNGQYCREFQQTVTVGGRSEQAYGTACQQPDGAWKVVTP